MTLAACVGWHGKTNVRKVFFFDLLLMPSLEKYVYGKTLIGKQKIASTP
jgi:hypothetical protein